jgi:nucleoside-diphosphate-sugar epimerase
MHLFISGASGLIGGTIAAKALAAGHRVSGLARDADRAAALEERGVSPVIGTLNDPDVLAGAARAADATIEAADAEAHFAARALVDALAGSGKALIRTSGSTIVGDHAKGMYASHTYTEDTPCERLPEKMSRIASDRMVLAAAAARVRSVVICPSLVYGAGLGLRRFGPQIPNFIALARESGAARHIGAGENIWSHVHAEDLADAYLLALEHAEAGSFFFVESGEATMRAMAQAIGRLLGFDGDPEPWSHGEAVRRWGPHAAHAMGGNSRVSAAKARALLGWTPTKVGMLEDIENGNYRDFLSD